MNEHIFEKKESRADIRYQPLVKDLKDAMCMGDLSKAEDRNLLAQIIENYG